MTIKYEVLQLSDPYETWYSLGVFADDDLLFASSYGDEASAVAMAKIWAETVQDYGHTTIVEISKEI